MQNNFCSFFFIFLQPFSKCDCPWLIKWVLGYKEFDTDKDKENMDIKIKDYLQGMK